MLISPRLLLSDIKTRERLHLVFSRFLRVMIAIDSSSRVRFRVAFLSRCEGFHSLKVALQPLLQGPPLVRESSSCWRWSVGRQTCRERSGVYSCVEIRQRAGDSCSPLSQTRSNGTEPSLGH